MWGALIELVNEAGPIGGTFIILFVLAHGMIFWLYRGRIEDRQKEIDRLAEDNREYRVRFLKILDEKFGYGTGGESDD